MKLNAELIALGDAQGADLSAFPPETSCAVLTRDRNTLLLIGLTHDEARELASFLFESVEIAVHGKQEPAP